jgi:nucleoside-diphosphate-sugar epimerase
VTLAGAGRRVLVTGGTGFLGSHVVEELLASGYRVRCLVRDPDRLRWLDGLDVELVPGDLESPELPDAVDGVETIFHFAGLTRGSAGDLQRTNHLGTSAVLAACRRAGVAPRFIYCSSQAAAGPNTPDRPRDETDPPTPISDYGRSKLAGEREVWSHGEEMPAVVLRPVAVYGPRDRDTLGFFQMARRGVLPVPGGRARRLQVVHARDVARAARLAAEVEAAAGGTYFIAHPEITTWRELARAIGSGLGRKVRPVPVPGPLIRAVGAVGDWLGPAPGVLDTRRARDLTAPAWTCRVDRALNDLGWRPEYGLERGLAETVRWYREHGWL